MYCTPHREDTMKVIICDDSRNDAERLQQYIQNYLEKKNIDCDIVYYTSALALDSDAMADCNILFMDIYMPDSNGMDTAKQLRSHLSCPIIFTSSSREFALEAFNVNATHYLVKPVTQEQVAEALDRCITALSAPEPDDIIEIKTAGKMIPVSVQSIVCIEVFNNQSVIHTIHSDLKTYTTLTTLYERLDNTQFMRPHRSYLVNMKYIRQFHFDRLTLDNGQEIILSRKKRTQLKQQYQSFLFRQARKGTL